MHLQAILILHSLFFPINYDHGSGKIVRQLELVTGPVPGEKWIGCREENATEFTKDPIYVAEFRVILMISS